MILRFWYFSRHVTMVQMGAKTTTITETDVVRQEMDLMKNVQKSDKKPYDDGLSPIPESKQEIIWTNVILITILHLLAVNALFTYMITARYMTIVWGEFIF